MLISLLISLLSSPNSPTNIEVVAMLRRCSCVAVEIQYTILLMRHNYPAINHREREREKSRFSGLVGPQGET